MLDIQSETLYLSMLSLEGDLGMLCLGTLRKDGSGTKRLGPDLPQSADNMASTWRAKLIFKVAAFFRSILDDLRKLIKMVGSFPSYRPHLRRKTRRLL